MIDIAHYPNSLEDAREFFEAVYSMDPTDRKVKDLNNVITNLFIIFHAKTPRNYKN